MKLLAFERARSGRHQSQLILFTAAAVALAAFSVWAQPTNVSELRELRVSCLESFQDAQNRLDELRAFVGQQARRERGVADELFGLRDLVNSARKRGGELRKEVLQCSNSLHMAQAKTERAATSHRTAVEVLPSGDAWAAEGAAALGELRRAVAAAPRDTWKYKRFKRAEEEYAETLQQWRGARRSMEHASFDLELRAAAGAFRRVESRIDTVSAELKALEGQLTERESFLSKLSDKSETWSKAIRDLRAGEDRAREQLAKIRFSFHLVDLRFAAWRLKQADLGSEGMEVLPDLWEQSLDDEVPRKNELINLLPAGLPESAAAGVPGLGSHGAVPEPEAEEAHEAVDATFRDLLARVDLAQARLQFLSEVLYKDSASVEAAVSAVEAVEAEATELAGSSARLAAEQEDLRRSLETAQATLTRGEETLGLVQKRFAADLKVINQSLKIAEERTSILSRRLEH